MKNKRILCCLTALLLAFPAVCPALASSSVSGLALEAYQGGVSYSFFSNEAYILLTYSTSVESGKMLLHAPDGEFSGAIGLTCTEESESLRVELFNLKGDSLAINRVLTVDNPLPAAYADHYNDTGETALKARNLEAASYPGGVQVDFDFPGKTEMILKYRTAQQTGELTIYADENYHYSYRLDLPLTYAATTVHLEIYVPRKADPVGSIDGKRGYELEAQVTETAAEGRLKGLTICLDPGHCSVSGTLFEEKGPNLDGFFETSPGLCGMGHFTFRRESIVVLEIAYLLRDELRRQGANVVMTREDENTLIGSIDRAQIAADAGADFMLRLHADDREDDEDIRGIQVYAPLNSTYAKACCTAQEYRAMAEAMMETIRDACGYSPNARGNIVQLNDNYTGNNWAQMPCFLIEMGFMSNRQDDYLLSDPDYQQLMAESIAEGVYRMALLRGLID